ncbi:MAG: hypothetical protein Q7T05_07475 [Dehalococcoidia bacterium]|nr:hypothetical protein [Dehalococcoidia bacterium]
MRIDPKTGRACYKLLATIGLECEDDYANHEGVPDALEGPPEMGPFRA